MNEWLDDMGYPTMYALARIRYAKSPSDALDALRAAWNYDYGSFSEELLPDEYAIVARTEPSHSGRFLRFEPGDFGGNEEALEAMDDNLLASAITMRLMVHGGLSIYEYPAESE